MDAALTLDEAMEHALGLARKGPVYGPNPQVGCVILAPERAGADTREAPRAVLSVGWHRGAGTPHAEADALARARSAGTDLRGATAVVTLEPCNHTGRTGPCAQALLEAGVAEVVLSVSDPNPVAAGGAERLRLHGVRVETGRLIGAGEDLLRVWLTSVRSGRPYVTLKTATSIDGCVAAADGSSRWITGPEARAHAHGVRATVDAILVGTETVVVDDPTLTARPVAPGAAVTEGVDAPVGGPGATVHQPLRVVMGERPVAAGARVRGDDGLFLQLPTHDVHEALGLLADREVRHVLVEGGPTVATAFLAAGVVDELHAYVAPVLVGEGRRVVGALGGRSIDDAARWTTSTIERLGEDALVVARADRPPP